MGPAVQATIKALDRPMATTLQEQMQRRTEAVAALVAYTEVPEPISTTLMQNHASPDPAIMLPLLQTADRAAKS